MTLLYMVLVIGVLGLGFALYKAIETLKKEQGTDKMKELSKAIQQGAIAFLHKEYIVLLMFLIIAGGILFYAVSQTTAIAFITGAIFSALAGNLGMRIATKANARTAQGAKKSINEGLKIAFSAGTVMGLCVVSLGLLGVTLLYMLYDDPNVIYGFGFGASSIALFARVGGGIFTKAADVGADLAGKVEKGIPEDDPRNPAVIADNVGDNVGDIAGMGADLFESYVNSIIAAMVVGTAVLGVATSIEKGYVLLPLIISAIGILASIGSTFFVRVTKGNAKGALNKGVIGASLITAVLSFIAIIIIIPNSDGFGVFFAAISGLIAGVVIGQATEYFTSQDYKPVRQVAEAAAAGAGTNIIQGLAVGMLSTIAPVVVVCIAIFTAHYFAGIYGIAIAAVGMLSTLGITLAATCYGPVADNSAGIAEMANMGSQIRKRCEELDAVGNTTAAIGKGFAIGSAALTALALFVSFTQIASQLRGSPLILDVTTPPVIIGLFLGALLPFVFCALTMKSVGRAAGSIISEVRRQWKQIKGLAEGKAKADYKKCISIATGAALKEMIMPGILAIVVPLLVGFLFGIETLGGLLLGATAAGFLLAVFMANAGAAWDNAKKYIEEGRFGGKGSDAHKAAVVGDTVGDPFKDTSGPSLNILIKLISIVSLVFLPLII